jgi:hypothetical protein
MRDDMISEQSGEEGNYFLLREEQRTSLRRKAVREALAIVPRWLDEHIGWALKQVQDGKGQREDVIDFAVDLLGSRFATIWSNQKSGVTRKQKDHAERESKRSRLDTEKCDRCSGEKQWCCLACELAKMNTVCTCSTSIPDCRHPLHHHTYNPHFISQTRWTRALSRHKRMST